MSKPNAVKKKKDVHIGIGKTYRPKEYDDNFLSWVNWFRSKETTLLYAGLSLAYQKLKHPDWREFTADKLLEIFKNDPAEKFMNSGNWTHLKVMKELYDVERAHPSLWILSRIMMRDSFKVEQSLIDTLKRSNSLEEFLEKLSVLKSETGIQEYENFANELKSQLKFMSFTNTNLTNSETI